jgi:hypothetical protein
MLRRGVETLAVASLLSLGSGCSLILDFDKPPVDGPPDSPVNDTACMANEPNDTPTTATAIVLGDYEAGICGSDTDYFKFTVTGAEAVLARITFMNRNGAGDIDLRLLNAAGATTIDESRTSADVEDVMCPGGIMCNGALPAGDYLLQVLGFNAAVQSQYVLHLEFNAVPIDAGIDAP